MRRRTVITAGIVLALIGAGALTANAMTLRDEPGAPQSVDPVVATPDPNLPTTSPSPSPSPTPSLAPVPPAPPEDVDNDEDDGDLEDGDDGSDDGEN